MHATRAAVEEGIVPGGGLALLRARRGLASRKGATLDHDSGLRIVENAGDEPSVVLGRVDENPGRAFGHNAANREFGDLPAMRVIDPAKVTRLAMRNAGSIAGLILTTACLIAQAPVSRAARAAVGALPQAPEF